MGSSLSGSRRLVVVDGEVVDGEGSAAGAVAGVVVRVRDGWVMDGWAMDGWVMDTVVGHPRARCGKRYRGRPTVSETPRRFRLRRDVRPYRQ
jgi:hypothetical protein